MRPRLFKTRDGLDVFLRGHAPGTALHIDVLHDDACTPDGCRCRPWYRVTDLTADGLIEGEQAQAKWMADCQQKTS